MLRTPRYSRFVCARSSSGSEDQIGKKILPWFRHVRGYLLAALTDHLGGADKRFCCVPVFVHTPGNALFRERQAYDSSAICMLRTIYQPCVIYRDAKYQAILKS